MTEEEKTCLRTVIHGDIVDEVSQIMPEAGEVTRLAAFFKVFGDETRLRVLWALDRHEMCVCDLAALLGMTKSAVSHQLRLLREGDLVRTRRDGRVIFYQLSDGHVSEVFERAVEHVEERGQ